MSTEPGQQVVAYAEDRVGDGMVFLGADREDADEIKGTTLALAGMVAMPPAATGAAKGVSAAVRGTKQLVTTATKGLPATTTEYLLAQRYGPGGSVAAEAPVASVTNKPGLPDGARSAARGKQPTAESNVSGKSGTDAYKNQAPYDPHAMRDMLQKNNPGAKIESTTLPKPGTRGTKHAGKRHPGTKIVYDNKGLPNFTDKMKYETQIPAQDFFPKAGSGKILADLRSNHMRQATRQLRADIKAGVVDWNMFTGEELRAIRSGKEKIGDFTWHHHERPGRMQLVKEDKHKAPHAGSIDLLKEK